MLKKISLLLTLALSVVLFAHAQQTLSPIYLDKKGALTNTVDSAFTRCDLVASNQPNVYDFTEIDIKTGYVRRKGSTEKQEYIYLTGHCVTCFADGTVESEGFYKDNRINGIYTQYYPNGKMYLQYWYKNSLGPDYQFGNDYKIISCYDSLGNALVQQGNGHFKHYDDKKKYIDEEGDVQDSVRIGRWAGIDSVTNYSITFTEQYENGKLIKGESINKSTGKKATYTSRQVRPEFYGGEAAFGSFLGQTVRYPKIARQANIQGRVYVYFVVNKDGTLGEFKIQKSPDESLSNEVLRVMALSPKWIPGKMYGFPVRVSYTVPVNFALSKWG